MHPKVPMYDCAPTSKASCSLLMPPPQRLKKLTPTFSTGLCHISFKATKGLLPYTREDKASYKCQCLPSPGSLRGSAPEEPSFLFSRKVKDQGHDTGKSSSQVRHLSNDPKSHRSDSGHPKANVQHFLLVRGIIWVAFWWDSKLH
ncbi:hypothetical protein E5288_WYG021485 [Bos mutus]|uniref:Uncharacterized protein n=1 Tax=Bos mutus TaxID=72004 RepID=A0A6B0R7C2_9CETA|nr:hypothetical protein [Bos mutus]